MFDQDSVMKSFPHGCCGDMSDLLGEYLLNHGVSDLWYVCGTHYPETGDSEYDFENRQSHAWITMGNPLKKGSIIIDITANQFSEKEEYHYYNKRVFIGKMDYLHSLFEVDQRDCRRFEGLKSYDELIQGRLYNLYSTIIENM